MRPKGSQFLWTEPPPDPWESRHESEYSRELLLHDTRNLTEEGHPEYIGRITASGYNPKAEGGSAVTPHTEWNAVPDPRNGSPLAKSARARAEEPVREPAGHPQEGQYKLFHPSHPRYATDIDSAKPWSQVDYMESTKGGRHQMMEGLAILQRDAALKGFGDLGPSQDLSPHSLKLSNRLAGMGLTEKPLIDAPTNDMDFEDPAITGIAHMARDVSRDTPVSQEERHLARSNLRQQLKNVRIQRNAKKPEGEQGTLF